MDRRTIRGMTIAAGLLGLAALGLAARWTKVQLFTPLERGGWRGAPADRTAPEPLRDRFPGLRSPLVIQQIGLGDSEGPVQCDGMPADWIELLNGSGRAVSLREFALADGKSADRRWTFPDVELPPGGSMVVWADGQDRVGSRWESRDPEMWPAKQWRRAEEEESPAGYVYQSRREEGMAQTPWVAYAMDLPEEGEYDCWLRHRAEEGNPCVLDVRVDGEEAQRVATLPGGRFASTRLIPARRGETAWKRKAGPVRVEVHLVRGAVSIDRVVATRRSGTFGFGEQDIHLPFKLKAAGETIRLHAPRGVPLDRVTFPALAAGETYRREPRGTGDFIAGPVVLQPGLARWASPCFSQPEGWVEAGTKVSAPAEAGCTVRVRTDGGWPDESSPEWQDLEIREPTMVTIRSFGKGKAPSLPVTAVFHPGPPLDIPLAWAVMPPEAEARLLRYRLARGAGSEQRTHLCLLMPDGSAQSADVALRPQGRSSRVEKVKQAYRIICRKGLGTVVWPGRIFEEEGAERHGSLVLTGTSLIRHPLALDIVRAHGFPAPRGRLVRYQLNRDPMGVYLLLEDPNDPEFLEQLYGHRDLDVIKLKTNKPVKAGDDRAFQALMNSPPGKAGGMFGPLEDWIRPETFLRWVALHHLLGITDNRQGYYVRDRRAAVQPWSFMFWDLDGAFDWAMAKRKGSWTPIMGEREDVFEFWFKRPDGRRRFVQVALRLLDEFDEARWQAQAAAYGEAVLQNIDFELAGRCFQKAEGREMDRDQIAAVFAGAVESVQHFLAEQTPLYRKSLQVE